MKPETKKKWNKYSTVIGCILLLLPNGAIWYWGNMSVYSLSYIVNVLDSTSGVDTPWIISTFIIFWTIGAISSGMIVSRIGIRSTLLIGAIVADISMFSGYFANQHSVMALTFSMGAGLGCGAGLIDGPALQLIMEWAGDDVSTLTSIIQSSFSMGGVIINQLVTSYTNPDNLLPDLKLGPLDYFTQKSVLDKVPYMYLIIGGFSVGMHIIGFSLLKQKPKEANVPMKEELNSKAEYASLCNQDVKHVKHVHVLENDVPSENHPAPHKNTTSKKELQRDDFTPIEMIKSSSFYVLWISFFIGNMPFLLLTNYYKIYGQLYIQDDHFLTNLGTAFVFLNIFTNVFWGRAMDKFGVKNCLSVFLSLLITVTTWYYFAPMVNKWLYVVATLLTGCLVGTIYSGFTAATVLMYGKAHIATNFGVIMTSSMIFNLIAPYLLRTILTRLGWFAIYAIAAGGNLLGFMLILSFIPQL